MKIRFATQQDVPAFVDMGRRFHAMTRFCVYDYDAERVSKSLSAVLQNPRGSHCFFVAEDSDGQAVGGLIGCIEQHFFSSQSVASVVHYDVLPEKRMGGAGVRLLIAFKQWAQNRGAVELSAGVNSGTDLPKLDKFLRRMGFKMTGGNYSLMLSSAGGAAMAPSMTQKAA